MFMKTLRRWNRVSEGRAVEDDGWKERKRSRVPPPREDRVLAELAMFRELQREEDEDLEREKAKSCQRLMEKSEGWRWGADNCACVACAPTRAVKGWFMSISEAHQRMVQILEAHERM